MTLDRGIVIKSQDEIDHASSRASQRPGARRVKALVRPGVTTADLNVMADEVIQARRYSAFWIIPALPLSRYAVHEHQ
jgi:hypothetical protein